MPRVLTCNKQRYSRTNLATTTTNLLGNILSGQHSSVGGSLISVGLDLHATSDPANGLTTGQVSDVHEGVVEGGVDVGNSEHKLTISDLNTMEL